MTTRDLNAAQFAAQSTLGIYLLDSGLKKLLRLAEMYRAQAKQYGKPEAAACLETAIAALHDTREELGK